VSALDISWKEHIDMQAIFQKHCIDGSISKTVNIPSCTTTEGIAAAFFYAWKKGCKGITFYREGTRDAVYNLKKDIVKKTGPNYVLPTKAPAIRYIVKIGCGKMAVIITGDPDTFEPIEVFAIPLSGGGCAGHCAGEGRTLSNALQGGLSPSIFISSLSKVICKACMGKEEILDGKSCPDAMGKKLAEFIRDSSELLIPFKEDLKNADDTNNICPKCKTKLIHSDGCISCPNPSCNWTGCN
jgi:ribonucleoside-diphosphate reductase alpha chain